MSLVISTDFSLPAYAQDALVPEAAFARAYEEVSAKQRGQLKKCIAQLFSWYGRSAVREERKVISHDSGLRSFSRSTPVDWTVLALDEDLRSPLQLLGALLPPLLAGVRNVFIVRTVGSPWNPALLTAAELAGVEMAFCSQDRSLLSRLVQDLSASHPQGRVISLGGASLSKESSVLTQANGIPRTDLQPVHRIGIWSEGSGAWDMQSLRFGHPLSEIILCRARGSNSASPEPVKEMSWSDFLDLGLKAVLVPEERIERAMDRVPLVLGPGQEGCWMWPSLDLHAFFTRSAGFCESPSNHPTKAG
jgi:hypothetical protein